MDFSLNDEHIALQDAVRRFATASIPRTSAATTSLPLAARRWQGMAELGLLGLPLGTDVGGSGLGAVESMLVAQELGRALGGIGWLSSVVAAGQLLDQLGSAAQRERWLPALASGRARRAGLHEAGARYDYRRPATQARRQGSGWVLEGGKTLVLDGAAAQLLIVSAQVEGGGPTLFVVEAGAPGVEVQDFATLDGRRAASVTLRGVALAAGDVLGEVGGALPGIEATADRVNAALCAEAAGALQALIDLSAEQLRTRKQFGALLAGSGVAASRRRHADRTRTVQVDGLRRGHGGGCR